MPILRPAQYADPGREGMTQFRFVFAIRLFPAVHGGESDPQQWLNLLFDGPPDIQ